MLKKPREAQISTCEVPQNLLSSKLFFLVTYTPIISFLSVLCTLFLSH
mgnify:CR=1 FL=1